MSEQLDFYYEEELHIITSDGFLYREQTDDFGNCYFAQISANVGSLIYQLVKEKKMWEVKATVNLSYPDQAEKVNPGENLVTEEEVYNNYNEGIYEEEIFDSCYRDCTDSSGGQ